MFLLFCAFLNLLFYWKVYSSESTNTYFVSLSGAIEIFCFGFYLEKKMDHISRTMWWYKLDRMKWGLNLKCNVTQPTRSFHSITCLTVWFKVNRKMSFKTTFFRHTRVRTYRWIYLVWFFTTTFFSLFLIVLQLYVRMRGYWRRRERRACVLFSHFKCCIYNSRSDG